MKSRTRIAALALAAVLMLGLGLNAQAAGFTDVPSNHWAYEYIDGASARGIVNGYTDGTFRPDGQVTYAQFAAMVCRALFPEELAARPETSTWYAPAMVVCDWYGVFDDTMLGVSRRPDDPMIRSELAIAIVNALSAAGKQLPGEWELAMSALSIPDLLDYSLLEAYDITVVYTLEIMNGKNGGKFDGKANMRRSEACKVLLLMMDVADDPAAPEREAPPAESQDPEPPAEPETPVAPNGRPLDAQSVYNAMIAKKAQYPEGMRWTNDDVYVWHADPRYSVTYGYGCAGFAFMLSDAAFGEGQDLPAREIAPVRFEDVRPGDILRVYGDTHSVIILRVFSDYVEVAEGNYNSSIHWGRTMTAAEVNQSDYMLTRYPD